MRRPFFVAILSLTAAFLLLAKPAVAATLTVDVLTDTGGAGCELRSAITSVNTATNSGNCIADITDPYGTNDTIQFTGALTGTISLTASLPTIVLSVNITAPTLPISINGNDNFRIFNINSATNNQIVSIAGLTITNGEVTNTSGGGINLETGDTLNLDTCVVSSNEAEGAGTTNGGGIHNNGGILNISDSTISGNLAVDAGGGIYQVSGTTTIVNSTISGNDSNGGGAAQGGAGLFVAAGTADLSNVTISDNDAANDGGGIELTAAATVNLNNVTIAGDNDAGDDGGGIFIAVGGTVNFSNTIIADNNAGDDGDDCFGTLTSADHNLVEDTGDCTIVGTTTNNITAVDPDLGALQNNGGPTSTHALLTGSAAIEAGNPNTPDGVAPNCETTDQRGIVRPQIVVCDIGAYEFTGFADLAVTKSVDNPSAAVGDTVVFTVTVTNIDNGAGITAEGIRVDDIITGPIEVTAVTPNGFACTNNIGSALGTSLSNTCTLASLAPGVSESFTIAGTVNGTGQIDNISSVMSSITADPVSSNNTAVASANADGTQVDLSITKTVDDSFALIGDTRIFTVVVTNNGSVDAIDIDITDQTNGNFDVTAVSGVTSGAGTLTCSTNTGDASGSLSNDCTLDILESGETVTLTITGDVTDLGQIDNTASVSSLGTVDPNPSNNTAGASISAGPAEADLSITKTVDDSSALVGDTREFTVVVTNNGSIDAIDVALTDQTNGNFDITNVVGATSGAGTLSCPPNTGDASGSLSNDCTLDVLEPGATVTLTITGDVTGVGEIDNTASVSSSGTDDPNLSNNTAGASINAGLAQADLSITKTVDDSSGSIGDERIFTVVVTNNGSIDAIDVSLTDQTNGNFDITDVSGVTSGAGTLSCSTNTGSASGSLSNDCTLDVLESGATITLTITGDVTGVGEIDNTASVSSSGTSDPNTSNNTAGASINGGLAEADLSITKTVDNSQAETGDTVTFTVAVTNNSSTLAAEGVTISDITSGPFTVTGAAFTVGTGACNPTAGGAPLTIVCTPSGGTIAASGSVEIEITGTVDDLGQVDNTASVSSSLTADPDSSNNTAVSSVVGTPQTADLSITKSVDVPQANIGETVTFTLTVENNGPDDASAVRVTDNLTGPITVTDVTASVGSCNPTTGGAPLTILCDLGTIASSGSATITIEGTVDALGQIDNIASVANLGSPATQDPDLSNNSAVASVNGTANEADLRITKDVDLAQANVGEEVTFTITVENDGPDDATNVQVTDVLSGPGNFEVTDIDTTAGTCNPSSFPISNPLIITCDLDSIANGGSVDITVVGNVLGLGEIHNTASVADTADGSDPATTDPNASNNTAAASVNGTSEADLAISKTIVGPSTVNIGDIITFQITIENLGPNDADNVTFRDIQLGGLSFADTTGIPGTCSQNGNILDCALDDPILDGDAIAFTFTMSADEAGFWSDIASVSSSAEDHQIANNTAANTITVGVLADSADLEVTKTANSDSVLAGDSVQYTVSITNNGPQEASDVVLTDLTTATAGSIAGVSGVSISDGSCGAPLQGLLVCSITDIEDGDTVTLTYTVQTGSAGTINNLATAGAATGDPDATNNSAAFNVEVTAPEADLNLVKTVGPNPDPLGGSVTYTLTVTNQGPEDAVNVVLLDQVSGSFSGVSASATDGGTCTVNATSSSTSAVECELGDMSANAGSGSNQVVVTVTVTTGNNLGVLSNTAAVSSDTLDPDLTDNFITADVLSATPELIAGDVGGCSLNAGFVPNRASILAILAGIAALAACRFSRRRHSLPSK